MEIMQKKSANKKLKWPTKSASLQPPFNGFLCFFFLFQLLGQIRRKAKQTQDACYPERPSALLHPERPLLPHQCYQDLFRRRHGSGHHPRRRRGGTKLED